MFPADLLKQEPMLAVAGKEADLARLDASGNYLFDVKWDGVRALAYVNDGVLTLRNRRGVNITHRYPDLVAEFAARYPDGEFVFDGEILVYNSEKTRFDFELALRRDCQSKPGKIRDLSVALPATYMMFDLLWENGRDLRNYNAGDRIAHMLHAAVRGCAAIQCTLPGMDAQTMWEAVDLYKLEGLVAKELTSRYVGQQSTSWVKIKKLQRCSMVATGYEPSKGGLRRRVGALYVALYEDGKQVPVGKVGTGFKDRDHTELLRLLEAGPFVVEVEFMEFSKNRELRQAAFKGVRTDIGLADCTMEQVRR